MDFSKLDLPAMADEGSDMIVMNPLNVDFQEPLLGKDGKPCTIKVIGAESRIVKDAMLEYNRTVAKNGAGNPLNLKAGLGMVLKIVRGWSDNWEWEEKPFSYSEANAHMIFGKYDWLIGQITNYVTRPSNFLPKQPSD